MSRVVLGKAALACLETDAEPRASFTRQPRDWCSCCQAPYPCAPLPSASECLLCGYWVGGRESGIVLSRLFPQHGTGACRAAPAERAGKEHRARGLARAPRVWTREQLHKEQGAAVGSPRACFPEKKLQGRLGCVLLSLNLQCLNPSRSIPRAPLHHPSTLPTFCLLRF